MTHGATSDAIGGIDHLVIAVSDLDRAAQAYRRLGFTLSPRAVHSAHMGTANHTIMLARDYFEVLGVLAPTKADARWRNALAQGDDATLASQFDLDNPSLNQVLGWNGTKFVPMSAASLTPKGPYSGTTTYALVKLKPELMLANLAADLEFDESDLVPRPARTIEPRRKNCAGSCRFWKEFSVIA